jgi:hypothetical protein
MSTVADFNLLTGFIVSSVVIRGLQVAPIELPPVVGRSFAAGIADALRADFPSATVTIAGRAHYSLDGVERALSISDTVQSHWALSLAEKRSGEHLLARLELLSGVKQ